MIPLAACATAEHNPYAAYPCNPVDPKAAGISYEIKHLPIRFHNAKPPDDRPAHGGWAPGEYCVECRRCLSYFTGDKRAYYCADCAYELGTMEQEQKACARRAEGQMLDLPDLVGACTNIRIGSANLAYQEYLKAKLEAEHRKAKLEEHNKLTEEIARRIANSPDPMITAPAQEEPPFFEKEEYWQPKGGPIIQLPALHQGYIDLADLRAKGANGVSWLHEIVELCSRVSGVPLKLMEAPLGKGNPNGTLAMIVKQKDLTADEESAE